MTPRLARRQMTRGGRLGRNALKREGFQMRKYLKKLLGGGRVVPQPMEAESSSSWICTSTSWSDMKIVRTLSEICTAEFASWTIYDEDFGSDDFLGECMTLYGEWTWYDEEEKMESYERALLATYRLYRNWCGDEYYCCSCCCECEIPCMKDEHLEEGMQLFTEWTAIAEEDAMTEIHDSLLMAALLSTREVLPAPSVGLVRAISCPDLVMASLAVLLFETRHFHYIKERLALSTPPKKLAALETVREMDPPNSMTTVSLPSGWDAVSTRLTTSSTLNLFSDRVASPIPSLFSIDPTGVPSTLSVTDSDESSSSLSTLFMDPSSVHSSLDSGCSSLLSYSSSSLSSSSSCHCSECTQSTTDEDEVSDHSHHTYTISSPSSGYNSYDENEPVILKKMTTTVSTQTEAPSQSSAAQMLAECDNMLEKLMEMKKRLKELCEKRP